MQKYEYLGLPYIPLFAGADPI